MVKNERLTLRKVQPVGRNNNSSGRKPWVGVVIMRVPSGTAQVLTQTQLTSLALSSDTRPTTTSILQLSIYRLAAAFVLALTVLPAQAQTASGQQACPGSTVDLQGAEFAAKSRAFLAELQRSVAARDKARVASMTSYPLTVIRGTGRTRVRNASQFLSQYETIFDAHVRRVIAQQSAKCLFGNYQGAMIGDGEVWFNQAPDGTMKVITVNPGAGSH